MSQVITLDLFRVEGIDLSVDDMAATAHPLARRAAIWRFAERLYGFCKSSRWRIAF